MTTALYTHPACLGHDNGAGHPESITRLGAVLQRLREPEFAALQWREAPRADLDTLELVHRRGYANALLDAVPAHDRRALDPDTWLSPGSGEAALRAVGAVCAAVDAVLGDTATNAFCAIRPPGHHAEPARAMGFCLFSNIAIGAAHACARHGLRRVAIVDFDVHHGNGTEAAVAAAPEILYLSTHQMPLYPGTGAPSQQAPQNVVNVALEPDSDGSALREAWLHQLAPRLEAWRPELILVSAGFDAHALDPLAQLRWSTEDYAWLSRELVAAANTWCRGRLVSALEGGYDLAALSSGVAAHVTALLAADPA